MAENRSHSNILWFMEELTSRIIADSGIPSDRHHLGKMILQSLKDYPDAILQIDGATGESETNQQVLEKTVKCSTCFRNFGLEVGDVVVLMAPNHIDLTIPFYAALSTGAIIAAVDRTLTVNELRHYLNIIQPKVIFCQSEKAPDVQLSLNEIDSNAVIVTFDKGDYLVNFNDFIEQYSDDTPTEDFKPTDFDPQETTAFLISTSGTTGLPKSAVVTHKNFALSLPCMWYRYTNFPSPFHMSIVGSPLQWLTALMQFVASPIFKFIRLQTSQNFTQDHAYFLINKYKPTFTIFSPTFMSSLLMAGREQCDFSCFEMIMLGGSAVSSDLTASVKSISPNTEIAIAYGMSELSSVIFHEGYAVGSCGTRMGCLQYRIVDINSQEEIHEPNIPGELWLKGPRIFKGYYKNQAATKEVFSEDGWFKTGDMLYRDENWNYFFIERIKTMLKYKSYQISPVEVENVIRHHPGVLDVAVTGISDPECGDLAVACVVPQHDYDINADEIKDLVRNSLSDSKQLRGGVIFLKALPMTASTKVHRRQLKELVQTMKMQ